MGNDFSQRDRDDAEEDQFWAEQRAAGITLGNNRPLLPIHISVIQDERVVYSEVYPIKAAGETEAAVSDAVGKASRVTTLKPWGWAVQVDKA